MRFPGGRRALLRWGALLVVIGVVTTLTHFALEAQQRQATTARALSRAVRERIGERIASDMLGELYVGATALLSRAGLGRLGEPAAYRGDPARILGALPALEACDCAPVLSPVYAFRITLDDGTAALAPASTPARVLPLDAIRRRIVGIRPATGWDFVILPSLDPAGHLLFLTIAPDDPSRIMGFAVDTATVRREIVGPLLDRRGKLLRLLGLQALDTAMVRVEVRLDGRALVTVGGRGSARDSAATSGLGMLFGELAVAVDLLGESETTLFGPALAQSPVAWLLVVAAGTILVMIAASLAWRRADRLADTRTALIAGMSHELRTPLTEVLLVAESVQRGHYPAEADRHQAMDVIVRESRRLLAMIENALRLSAGDRERPALQRAQPLGAEVVRVVEDYRLLAATRRVTLAARILADPPVAVASEDLRQVLVNLLDNACRHGPPGSEVVVRLGTAGGMLRLEVIDQGEGIPAALGARAWDLYAHQATPFTGDQSGHGIGLAVVRQLVTRYGGRSHAERDPSGHRVWVEFPLESA